MDDTIWMFVAPFVLFIAFLFALGFLQLGLFIVGLAVRLGLFVLQIPFMIRRYWFQQTEREAALSRAANGTALLVAAVLSAYWIKPMPDYMPFPWVTPVLAIWGFSWVSTGFGWRSRGLRDGRLLQRFSIRLILGIAALILVTFARMIEMPLLILAGYLILTALVKMALVLRGMPRERVQKIPQTIHGTAFIARFKDDD